MRGIRTPIRMRPLTTPHGGHSGPGELKMNFEELTNRIHAIGELDPSELCSLIQQHPSVANARGSDGQTLLHEASGPFSAFGPVEPVIRALMVAGVDLEARDLSDRTALHWAASPPQANLEALAALIALGANVNALSESQSPLHLAVSARCRRPGAVKLLLRHGADPNLVNRDQATALHFAAGNGLLEEVQLLMEAGARPDAVDAQQLTPLTYARIFAWSEVVDWLRRRSEDQGIPEAMLLGFERIHPQVLRGDPAIVDAMLTLRPELLHAPDLEGGGTPAIIAAREGRIEMLEVLLRHGMDPNDNSADNKLSLLGLSQICNKPASVRWLIDHGARPAHRSRHEHLGGRRLMWDQIAITGERRFIPDAPAFERLRTRLQGDPPAGYAEFMSRFGNGELVQRVINDQGRQVGIERFAIHAPDRIVKNNRELHDAIVNRLIGEPGHELILYPNVSDVFTEKQIKNLVVAGSMGADHLGFVQGEHGWYAFTDDGLIEYAGDDLQQALCFLVQYVMFEPGVKVLFKPVVPTRVST